MDIYDHWNYFGLKMGKLVSLKGQGKGVENINITKFCLISLDLFKICYFDNFQCF